MKTKVFCPFDPWFLLLMFINLTIAYVIEEKNRSLNKWDGLMMKTTKSSKQSSIDSTNDKCEIEILTRGSCLVNNNRLKPRIILHLKTKPDSTLNNHLLSPKEKLAQKKIQQKFQQKPFKFYQEKEKNLENKDGDNENDKELDYKKHVIYEFVSQVVRLMKIEYGHLLKPLIIETVQNIRLKNFGRGDVYGLKITGLDQIEPIPGSIEFDDSLESPVWSFNVTFFIANMTANFKADVNVNEKIFVKNWDLAIRIEHCQFRTGFMLDFDKQQLLVTSIQIKSFGDFKLITEPLTWPFNEIVSNIVSQEKYFIRHIIESYAEEYINMTLNDNFDLNSILQKIFHNNET